MKVVLLSIISVMISFSAGFANNKYEGSYVTKTGDTIKCKIKLSGLLLKKQQLNPLSVTRNLRVELPNGENRKFNPNEIRSFKIIGLENGPVEFKSISGDDQHFYQVWTEGKINLYAFYSAHPYDHSPVPHFFTDTNTGKLKELRAQDLNQELGELIKDDKELYNRWLKKEYRNSGLVPMLQLYNSRFLASSGTPLESAATISATKN